MDFDKGADALSAQGSHSQTVPSGQDYTFTGAIPKAIYVGGAGDVAMIGANAPAQAAGNVWKNVPAGAVLPFRPRKILAATTATDILAIY